MALDPISIITSIGTASESVAVQLVLGFLDVNFPFLNLPIISTLTEKAVGYLVSLLVSDLEIVTIDLVELIKTANQESDFVKAVEANINAQGGSDESQKKEAMDKLIASARSFYKLTP